MADSIPIEWKRAHKRLAIVGGGLVILAILVNLLQVTVVDLEQLEDQKNTGLIYANLGVAALVGVAALCGSVMALLGIVLHWRRAVQGRKKQNEAQ